MNFKRLSVILLVALLAVTVAAIGCQAPAQPTTTPKPTTAAPSSPTPTAASPSPTAKPTPSATTHPPVELEFLATSAGTGSYLGSAATADIINKNIPWIKMSLTATLGSDQNVISGLQKDPKKLIFSLAEGSYVLANAGLPPFDKKITSLRYMMTYGQSYLFWVTLDSSIKTPQDMIGKRIAISPVAQFNGKVGDWLLEEYGIVDKVKVSRLDLNASAEALKDGLVDVIITSLTGSSGPKSPPLPALKDLIDTRGDKVSYISWDFETLNKISKRLGIPLNMDTIPAGTLGPRQTQPIQAFSMVTVAQAAFEGADPDVIYEIVKTIATNYKTLQTYHPSLKDVTPETMAAKMPVRSEAEVSSGALKYYKEAGLWPPKK